jgi:hypothetical protein
MPDPFPVTDRTRVVREANRAVYDRAAIYQILDEGFVCHVGFTVDDQPFVIPTMYARAGDDLYFHGSAASRMLRGLSAGLPVCITVTLTDGLVLARSVFNHSMNYRSVVVLGQAKPIDDPLEKLRALQAFTEKLIPGRWNDARQPNEKELKATSILKLPLTEVSAKVRTGPVEDDADDYLLPVWAGVIPLRTVADPPLRDERCDPAIPAPAYAFNYRRLVMNEFISTPVKPVVQYSVLEALDIRVGTIERVEAVPRSEKLMRLIVNFGDHSRVILAGIRRERENPREIEGKQSLFVVNLEPRKMAGEISEGMLFDLGYADGLTPVLAMPECPVPNGTRAG